MKFFLHFVRLTIRGVTFFVSLLYRKAQMTLRLSLAKFCRPSSSFAFNFLQHDVHIHRRRDYDKQKEVVVMYASFNTGIAN